MSRPLQIMVKSTGKLIQCIQRIASGCFLSRRILAETGGRGVSTGGGGAAATGSSVAVVSGSDGGTTVGVSGFGWTRKGRGLVFSSSSVMTCAPGISISPSETVWQGQFSREGARAVISRFLEGSPFKIQRNEVPG